MSSSRNLSLWRCGKPLGVSTNSFGERTIPSLDLGGKVNTPAGPGVAGWRPGRIRRRCKIQERPPVDAVPNADLYQLLAYTTALDLPGGLLIYAEGEDEPATYEVRNAGKRLEVAALDLSRDA